MFFLGVPPFRAIYPALPVLVCVCVSVCLCLSLFMYFVCMSLLKKCRELRATRGVGLFELWWLPVLRVGV